MGDAVVFMGSFGGKSTRPLFAIRTREALADYCQRRASKGRRKWAEAFFDLSPELARTVVEGTASAATIDHCFRVRGWEVALEVLAEVIGHGLDQHLARQRAQHEQTAARLAATAADLRAAVRPGDRGSDRVAVRLAGDRGSERVRVGQDQAKGA